jgi:hypothetical protein
MNDTLSKLRDEAAEAQEREAWRKPREAQSELAGDRAKAVAEREALAREIPIARPILEAYEKKAGDYAPHPSDSGDVPRLLRNVNDLLRGARNICARRLVELDSWRADLDDLQPKDFRFRSAPGLIDDMRRRLSCILGGSQILKELPEKLAELEKLLEEEGCWLKERRMPPSKPAMTPKRLPPDRGDPNEPPALWDARDPRTFGK